MNRSSRSASPEQRKSDHDSRDKRSPHNDRSNSPGKSPKRDRSGSEDNAGNVVYVGNLSRKIQESEVREHFGKFGKLADVNLIVDPSTNECRGFAFLKYENPADAEACLKLDNEVIDGRSIKVQISKRGSGHRKTPGQYLGHYNLHGRRRNSPPRYRQRSPRGGRRSSRDRDYRDDRRRDDRYRDHERDRDRGGYHDKYRDSYRDRDYRGDRDRDRGGYRGDRGDRDGGRRDGGYRGDRDRDDYRERRRSRSRSYDRRRY